MRYNAKPGIQAALEKSTNDVNTCEMSKAHTVSSTTVNHIEPLDS